MNTVSYIIFQNIYNFAFYIYIFNVPEFIMFFSILWRWSPLSYFFLFTIYLMPFMGKFVLSPLISSAISVTD